MFHFLLKIRSFPLAAAGLLLPEWKLCSMAETLLNHQIDATVLWRLLKIMGAFFAAKQQQLPKQLSSQSCLNICRKY